MIKGAQKFFLQLYKGVKCQKHVPKICSHKLTLKEKFSDYAVRGMQLMHISNLIIRTNGENGVKQSIYGSKIYNCETPSKSYAQQNRFPKHYTGVTSFNTNA